MRGISCSGPILRDHVTALRARRINQGPGCSGEGDSADCSEV